MFRICYVIKNESYKIPTFVRKANLSYVRVNTKKKKDEKNNNTIVCSVDHVKLQKQRAKRN